MPAKTLLSEHDSSQLFFLMPFAALVRSLDTAEIVAVNRELERVTGYRSDGLVGEHPVDAGLYVNEHDFNRKVTELALRGKVNDRIIDVRKKDGTVVETAYSAAVIPIERRAYVLVVFPRLGPAT